MLHILAAAFLSLALAGTAGAQTPSQAEQMAAQTLAYLQNSAHKVVLLGRVGSDAPEKRFIRKVGIWNYTHAGLAFRNYPAGEWTIVHLRNINGEVSGVFEETVTEFFMDNPYQYRVVVAAPSAAMQNALEEIIVTHNAAVAFRNNSVYSSISYPYSLDRQNSNEYVLDLFAAALALGEERQLLNRRAAKNYFLASQYRDFFAPEAIKVGFVEKLAVSLGLGPDNATLDDHPPAEHAAGEFEFVSVGALIQFLEKSGNLLSAKEMSL